MKREEYFNRVLSAAREYQSYLMADRSYAHERDKRNKAKLKMEAAMEEAKAAGHEFKWLEIWEAV